MPLTAAELAQSRSGEIVTILTCMISLATVVLVLRLMTRLGIQHMAMGADDWTVLAAWVFSLAFTVDVCVQTNFGLGKHVLALPPTTNFATSLELFYFGEMLYYVTVAMTKVSILILYIKLTPNRTFRTVVWSMMAFVLATAFSCVMADVFQCNPIRKAWDTSVKGTCINQVGLYLSNGGLNIAQDIIIYFLPVPMLWKLNMPRTQRIALVLVFVVGGFVVITGMIRLNSLKVASVSSDPTWDNFGAAIWSSIESNVGIVCASLVHFKAVFARYAPQMLGIQYSGGSGMRIPDSDDRKDRNIRTFGQSDRTGKKVGILTELELEDNTSQSNIISSGGDANGTYALKSVGGGDAESDKSDERPARR